MHYNSWLSLAIVIDHHECAGIDETDGSVNCLYEKSCNACQEHPDY